MTDNPLAPLRAEVERLEGLHNATCEAKGVDHWTWLRAIAHMSGDPCRRNNDTSRDAELAGDREIEASWKAYIQASRAYELARFGPNGVLGGR